jgi:hypothetical protein
VSSLSTAAAACSAIGGGRPRRGRTASATDEIVEGLRAERVLPVATDLIAQFNPGIPDRDAAIRALELIATEVALALGRQPHATPAGV